MNVYDINVHDFDISSLNNKKIERYLNGPKIRYTKTYTQISHS